MDNNSTDPNNLDTVNIPPTSPDVEELNKRRSLIKSLYLEILGKDADINGLSYYTVHKEIPEDEIRKQMSQSTDHRDIVIKAQKYHELEKKSISLEEQLLRMQNMIIEKDMLITNLRALTSTAPQLTQQQPMYGNGNFAQDFMTYNPDQGQFSQQNGYNMPNTNQNPYAVPQQQPVYTQMVQPRSAGCIGWLRRFLGI